MRIAFDPDYDVNNFVYIYYTSTDLLNYLVRFDTSGDTAIAEPVIIYQTYEPSGWLHIGGTIAFGPDGKLYLSVGDNGYGPNAQDLSNPHGTILRLNKDGSIPTDNPFFGQPGVLPEIWAYGLRNPFRFQFDSVTGVMLIGDVGDFSWEEVNQGFAGGNYGWPICEGICGNPAFIEPIHAYPHAGLSSSVTGGPIYRGSTFPAEYQGDYFFGDYAQGFIKRLDIDIHSHPDGTSEVHVNEVLDFDPLAGTVVDFKVAEDGSLYYITIFPGELIKVQYGSLNPAPVVNTKANKTGGRAPLRVKFSSRGTYDPNGDPLTYSWDFGDGTTSDSPNPRNIYRNEGTYCVQLSVSDGENTTFSEIITVVVGAAPIITVEFPQDASNYRAGDTVQYSATATDADGNPIPDEAFTTEGVFHHLTHVHSFFGPLEAVRQGSFTVPTTGESTPFQWYEIKFSATDGNGITTQKSVNIYPVTANFTLNSNPQGLTTLLDGTPQTTPTTVERVVGFESEVSVGPVQQLNNQFFEFNSWSDGGAQTHTVTVPEAGLTLTANFDELIGIIAEYFNNMELAGEPLLTRQDLSIDFNWALGSPDPLINPNNFSVRWTTQLVLEDGAYRFTTTSDDGVRVFLDGQLIINQWNDHGATTYFADLPVTAGEHELIVEYYENTWDAQIVFGYSKISELTGDFVGEYFDNMTLSGAPVLVRNDGEINFEWGYGPPDPAMLADNFSVRWIKSQDFEAGTYTFQTETDDGVRFYLDDQMLIDNWTDHSRTIDEASVDITQGSHTLRIEYYESGWESIAIFRQL